MPGLLIFILEALWWIIMIDAVLSWVTPADQFPRSLTAQITDPLYAPIRALISPEKTGGVDLSPLVMLMLISAMKQLIKASG